MARALRNKRSRNSDTDDAKTDTSRAQPQVNRRHLSRKLAANQDQHATEATSKPPFWRKRVFRYLVLLVIALAVIWSATIAYITYLPPEYKVKWTLLIPGSGTGSNLNLENLGQATTSVNSAYSSQSVDPKVNYKAIAVSRNVLETAANLSDLSVQEFGKPSIKLIDQTTLIEFSVTDNTAEGAYQRAINHDQAFQAELQKLREDEMQLRRSGTSSVLQEYQDNVDKAQADILEYKSQSSITSTKQVEQLASNIEDFKKRRADATLKLANVSASLNDLKSTLGVDIDDADKAIKLQNDPVFQALLEARSDAIAELTELRAVWGSGHPKVQHSQARVTEAVQALLSRALITAGITRESEMDDLLVSESNVRSSLYNDLIRQSAEETATRSELNRYESLIADMESELQDLSRRSAILEDLERKHQAATAIFVSVAAKTDLGKSDIYASYPMTQMLTPPIVPSQPEKLKQLFAVLGAIAGSIMVALSLVIAWQRYVLLQKLRKSL